MYEHYIIKYTHLVGSLYSVLLWGSEPKRRYRLGVMVTSSFS